MTERNQSITEERMIIPTLEAELKFLYEDRERLGDIVRGFPHKNVAGLTGAEKAEKAYHEQQIMDEHRDVSVKIEKLQTAIKILKEVL